MKKSISKKLVESAGSLELGKIIGQQSAFSLIAGRCSAAEAAAIRRIRRERLYEASGLNWNEFCSRHFGMSRTQADRVIGQLEEFGPEYFELTQLTRIAPEAYRAIAPAVKDGHIHWRNEAIALLPENSEKVAEAVADLRESARPEAAVDGKPAALGTVDALKQRTDQVVGEWARLVAARCTMPPAERQQMKNWIARARQEMQRLEGQVWG